MRISSCALAIALTTSGAWAAPAMAQQRPVQPDPGGVVQAEVRAGVEYERGDYGTGEKIEKKSAVATARVRAGRVILSASLPYVRVDAPGNVVAGGGGLLGLPIIVDPTQPATRVRRQGVGDLRLGAAVVLPVSGVDLAAYGQVKLPTASAAKRLGTGKTDFTVGAELSKTIAGVTPFVGVGYTLPGQPDGYSLRNSVSGQAGIGAKLGGAVSGQLAYGYAQSLSRQIADEQQVSARLDARLGKRLSLGVYGSAGTSETAADVAAGLQLGLAIF